MADDHTAFIELKKEIRSILATYQKGCDLYEFRKVYRELIGRNIPFERFDFHSDIDLFFDIPDVATITQRGGGYHLSVVANEDTEHITKMVASQKAPSKKKGKPPRYNKYSTNQYASRSNLYSRPSYPSRPYSNYSRPASSTSRPASSTSRPASFASRPSSFVSRPASVATNHVPIVSDSGFVNKPALAGTQTSAANNPSTFTSAIGRPVNGNPSSFASSPSSVASNHVSHISNSGVSRPPSTVSNSSNNPPLSVSRQPTAANTSSSFVPVVNKPVVSNQESFLASGNPTLARSSAGVSSNPATSAATNSCYSRQFQKDLPPRFRTAKSSAKLLTLEEECKIVDVVRKFSTGIRSNDFALAYQRNYDHQFSFESHGFDSLQECLETIPVLSMKASSNKDYTIYFNDRKPQQTGSASGTSPCASWATPSRAETNAHSENISQTQTQNAWSFSREPAVFETPSTEDYRRAQKSKADALDTFEASSLGLTENIRSKFQKIISENKHGIWARDFPRLYEKTTGSQFDLHSLGFTDLAGLVDSLPDIFRRKRAEGSRNDWFIVPVAGCDEEGTEVGGESSPKVGALLIDCVIESIRQILQGYSEGIRLNEFLQVYSINCNEPLHIVDLGFDSIENFLLSIASRVPLKIELEGGVKTIFLDGSREVVKDLETTSLQEEDLQEEDLPESTPPFDAIVTPDCKYKKQDLPQIVPPTGIPVYTSEIISPTELFIQLADTSKALMKLSYEIHEFYQGPHSNDYYFQARHIAVGTICACFWLGDQSWYRAIILSVVSQEAVRVFYVDYGNTGVAPRNLLRYLKEPFAKLPAQALKARLAYVKPPKNLPTFGPEPKKRMLQLCKDVECRAYVIKIKDGVLFLCLGIPPDDGDEKKKKVYVNDILIAEKYSSWEDLSLQDEPVLPTLEEPVLPTQEEPGLLTPEKPVLPPQEQPPPETPHPLFQGLVYDPAHVLQAQSFYQVQNALMLTMPAEDVIIMMANMALLYPNNPLIPRASVVQSPGGSVIQAPGGSVIQAPGGSVIQAPGGSVIQAPVTPMNNILAYQTYERGGDAYHLPLAASGYQFGAATNQTCSKVAENISTSRSAGPPGFSTHQSVSRAADHQSRLDAAAHQSPSETSSVYQSLSRASSSMSLSEGAAHMTPVVADAYQAAAAAYQSDSEESSLPSDIFEDDDEFNAFLEHYANTTKRYVKRVRTGDGYLFHILIVEEQLYISSGDISTLIWINENPGHLLEKLQSRNDVFFKSRSITEMGNENMFEQFEKFYVKGIQRGGRKSCITIYDLKSAMDVLNTYGHPSLELRQEIVHAMESFNPNLPEWQEVSETEFPTSEEPVCAVTDDDKLKRLCIHELIGMIEGIRIKQKDLMRTPMSAYRNSELEKLDNLRRRVKPQIRNIQSICRQFATRED